MSGAWLCVSGTPLQKTLLKLSCRGQRCVASYFEEATVHGADLHHAQLGVSQ